MSDPLFFRGIERLLIVVAAIVFAVLGYLLYRRAAASRGRTDIKFILWGAELHVTGTGAGIAFMGLGAAVLMVALFRDATSDRTTEREFAQSAETQTGRDAGGAQPGSESPQSLAESPQERTSGDADPASGKELASSTPVEPTSTAKEAPASPADNVPSAPDSKPQLLREVLREKQQYATDRNAKP